MKQRNLFGKEVTERELEEAKEKLEHNKKKGGICRDKSGDRAWIKERKEFLEEKQKSKPSKEDKENLKQSEIFKG